MHTEHLHNVRPVLLVGGWLIAVAVASLAFFAVVSAGLADPLDSGQGAWAVLAVVAGFLAGGFFAGFRSLHAPILHGIGIGIVSLVAWFVVNLLATLLPGSEWQGLSPAVSAGLLLAQMVAAVAGAWGGYRLALRDQPEPED